ncbi:hypothetical protein JKP88DRAFT_273130 [Tribonema minus]|uniref:Uncharacterized protein n=1 Tax=Tribonema minus TaxID=303371 RepID=A0A835YXC7_9STRA|nr:hypothetical protein JKP88DRAFT_273130 [Tribonema minus]
MSLTVDTSCGLTDRPLSRRPHTRFRPSCAWPLKRCVSVAILCAPSWLRLDEVKYDIRGLTPAATYAFEMLSGPAVLKALGQYAVVYSHDLSSLTPAVFRSGKLVIGRADDRLTDDLLLAGVTRLRRFRGSCLYGDPFAVRDITAAAGFWIKMPPFPGYLTKRADQGFLASLSHLEEEITRDDARTATVSKAGYIVRSGAVSRCPLCGFDGAGTCEFVVPGAYRWLALYKHCKAVHDAPVETDFARFVLGEVFSRGHGQ